jgi:hypothetical protein
MKFAHICCVAALLFMASCKKDESNSVNLKFAATYKSAPLALSPATVSDDSLNVVKYEELNFLLSHIQLVKQDNSVVKLADVSYLDFVDASNSSSFSYTDIPVGTYKALQFSIGLDSLQNEEDPSEISESDPRQKAQYWGWLKYVFLKVEGKANIANSGTANFSQLLLFHVGSDPLYRTITVNGPIEIKAGNNSLPVNFDLHKLFFGPQPVDIKVYDQSYTHSEKTSASYQTAVDLADNIQQAFSIGQ